MGKKLNEYVITKDGKDCDELMFDTIAGYKLAKQTVRNLSKKHPNFKWGARNLGTDYKY